MPDSFKIKSEKFINIWTENLKKEPVSDWICEFKYFTDPSEGFEINYYNKNENKFEMLGKKKNDLLYTLYIKREEKKISINGIIKKYAPDDQSKKALYDYRNFEDFDGLGLTYKISELKKAFEDLTYYFTTKLEDDPKDHYYSFKNRPWTY